ncbi:MAG: CDP-alcohol phosphatidyltransferase family protein [Miniphocaeibacter sp.]|uniref:CDP-alcohol phosphatidyltransferase family protein n=1 Tax=Miniphocaeibacter sp. TaxID=3100973 RepID=UPI00182924F9|nr:CDP-diacylglycerol--serine O-phosphatidyltransferase [Gallicola sp.]
MKKKKPISKWKEQLPNTLTTINLTMGILAIFLLIGDFTVNTRRISCLLIFVGMVADALDGKVARALGVDSEMGKQLDSFADSITFGLAPMIILYSFKELQTHNVLFLAIIIYPLAGVYRLARYNLGDFSDFFLGLPITAAGSIVALYCLLLSFSINIFGNELAPFTALIIFILSGLMVSTVSVPRLGTKKKEVID